MSTKTVDLTPALQRYIGECHSYAGDPLLAELRQETATLGSVSQMQISPEQGTFLSILVAALGVRAPVEIGTFTGYSALCMARALPPQGHLTCFDVSDTWTAIARRYWERAGVSDRITLQLGDAAKTLAEVPEEPRFDFAFIDADKTGYDTYFELLLPRLQPGSLLIFDNMLWGGRLTTEVLENPNGIAIDALNRKLAQDPRVESVLLPVADGLHLCRKR